MKPKTISYSESKESVDSIGLKSWRKAGVEIELDGDGYDDVKQAFGEAKRIVDDALSSSVNFGFIDEGMILANLPIPKITSTNLPTINKEKEKIEIAIDNCETLYELDLLMGDIAKHQLVPQYLEKKKSLK